MRDRGTKEGESFPSRLRKISVLGKGEENGKLNEENKRQRKMREEKIRKKRSD